MQATISLRQQLMLALLSGLLLGSSYAHWSPVLTGFAAIIPLLWMGARLPLHRFLLSSLGANLLGLALADWSIWSTYGLAEGSLMFISQAILWTLPWLAYHQLYHRHNPKLGRLMLVCCWLMLEWFCSNFIGWWQGHQLGNALLNLPALAQWFCIFGLTGGSLWLLIINIQVYRYFFPDTGQERQFQRISTLLWLLVPISVSLVWQFSQSNISKIISIQLADATSGQLEQKSSSLLIYGGVDSSLSLAAKSALMAKGPSSFSWRYRAYADTLQQALLYQSGRYQPLYCSTFRIAGIGGIAVHHSLLTELGKRPVALVTQRSLRRAEATRIGVSQGASLLLAFGRGERLGRDRRCRLRQQAKARALENQQAVLVFTQAGEALQVHPDGSSQVHALAESPMVKAPSKKASFFSKYGDLAGRLSIFVAVWLMLATIVKPFRKNK